MYDSTLIESGCFIVAVLDEKLEMQEATEVLYVFEAILSEMLEDNNIRHICGIYHEKASFVVDVHDQGN